MELGFPLYAAISNNAVKQPRNEPPVEIAVDVQVNYQDQNSDNCHTCSLDWPISGIIADFGRKLL